MSKTKILLIYLIIISTTILVVNSGITSPFRGWLRIQIPNLDKVGHFFGMGILAFLAWNVISKPQKKLFSLFNLLVISILISLITLEEYSQKFIVARSFSYGDLLADYLGIIIFSLLFILIKHQRIHFKLPFIKS